MAPRHHLRRCSRYDWRSRRACPSSPRPGANLFVRKDRWEASETMAFGDFTFPQVKDDLDLTVDDVNLYSEAPAISVREDFASTIAEGTILALAINTEKA